MDKNYLVIGLASKAGKTVTGESMVLEAIRNNEVYLVIVAGDASDNTKKKFMDKCSFYNIKSIIALDKESLGSLTGKESRTVIAITDEGMSKSLLKKIGGQ